jgi:hypothetical protein
MSEAKIEGVTQRAALTFEGRSRRRRALPGALLSMLLLGAGCGDSKPAAGADASVGAIPVGAATYLIQLGAGVTNSPGGGPLYLIAASSGGAYRLTWTGNGSARPFRGSVYTTGEFGSIVRGCASDACVLGSGDTVSAPISVSGGQRIDFSANTAAAIVGFDFIVSSEPVYFDLFIDGTRQAERVNFASPPSGTTGRPEVVPFALTGG